MSPGVGGAAAQCKRVTDREADEIDRDFDLPPLRRVEQRTCLEITNPTLARATV